MIIRIFNILFFFLFLFALDAQVNWDKSIEKILPTILEEHKNFVSLPNVAVNSEDIYKNLNFATKAFESRKFSVRLLESSSLPVFFAERTVENAAKSILFYLHIDGQAVNPTKWDQEDPFIPVLKTQNKNGEWNIIAWENIYKKIDPEWRIFGRSAADDKGPIMMMLAAIDLLDEEKFQFKYNIKIILDTQEEAGSEGFLSTIEKYKDNYAADYMIIMDGPAHNTNEPTLTFGCRGNATCSITVYGAKLPQHSGHYGNYAPNPVFTMSHLLAGMKNEDGRVIIKDYYSDVNITPDVQKLLSQVPDDEKEIKNGLGINKADNVGRNYQESLQYPSLNVRQIETSWKGPGLKTVIPEIVTAYIDVRLVAETDGAKQLEKIKNHIISQGYLLLDREPTDAERLSYAKIVKFEGDPGVNAFRTEMDAEIGQKLIGSLEKVFGKKPISIRTMGGTVPIIPAVNTLKIPAIIVPMVNMDNNQHNPNENLRIGNMIQGIKMCMVILSMNLE